MIATLFRLFYASLKLTWLGVVSVYFGEVEPFDADRS